jgi:hypothetical protein
MRRPGVVDARSATDLGRPLQRDRATERTVDTVAKMANGRLRPPSAAALSCFKRLPPRSIQGRVAMQTIKLAALMCFVLGTSAMAGETVPEEYQGIWAAARDCKENLQNVLADVVNRRFAACRVTQVQSSGQPESHTRAINMICGGSPSREIWRAESIGDTDYLVVIHFEQSAEAGIPSIEMYERCPGIPLGEIALSKIPGDPVADTAVEEKIAPSSRGVQPVRRRPSPRWRATHARKHSRH